MNHPTPEQWMDWLYRELPAEQHRDLDAHLAMCAECRAQVQTWRSTMGALDEWKAPDAPKQTSATLPVTGLLRWAAAAAIVLGIGIGIGRWTAPGVDTAALQDELKVGLQAELQRELERIHSVTDAARMKDREELAAVLAEIQEEHAADYTRLRRDLETMAIAAENRLYQTEVQLVRLTGNTAGQTGRTQ